MNLVLILYLFPFISLFDVACSFLKHEQLARGGGDADFRGLAR